MRPIRWLRRGVTLVTLGATGAAAAVTLRHLLDTPQPLESALRGEEHLDRKHGGNLFYNTAGSEDARPMVLLHDFYPGASNFEFRHVFPRFASAFRVYAPDWLGFGMSEHPHVAYTGEFYANMLAGFLRDVVTRPAVVIGVGRAANIAVRAASDTPELFQSLVLVSPYALAGIELNPTFGQALARAAQRTSLGLVPYAVLSTGPALRRQLDARTARRDDPESRATALGHLSASAHQFGGHHALLALLTGELDLPMQNALALMEPPALIVSGGDDPAHPREEMEDLAIVSPHTDLEVIPGAGESVIEDQPAAFVEVVLRWLRQDHPRQELSDDALLPLPDVAEQSPVPEPREPAIEIKAATSAELMERAPGAPKATTTAPVRTPEEEAGAQDRSPIEEPPSAATGTGTPGAAAAGTEAAGETAPGETPRNAGTPGAATTGEVPTDMPAPGEATPDLVAPAEPIESAVPIEPSGAAPSQSASAQPQAQMRAAPRTSPRAARGPASQPRGRSSRPLEKPRGQNGERQGPSRRTESRMAPGRHEGNGGPPGGHEGTSRGGGRRRGERRNGQP